MSKCDITISFDRADRVYRGGEKVSGTVSITVNQDARCNAITLDRFWRTHGRGNRAKGPVMEEVLADKPRLMAGERMEFPFSFDADCFPVTYHGHYINVDHYVRVRVDVPWASDPKKDEDFVVLPDKSPMGVPIPRDKKPDFEKKSNKKSGLMGTIIIYAILALFIIPILMLVMVLGPFALLFLGGRRLYRWFIENRIGKVKLLTNNIVVAPGENWPVEFTLVPRKKTRFDSVSVQLVGQERCVSGSGSNRTTHRQTFYDATSTLVGSQDVNAGERFSVNSSVPMPETNAYSLDASDNDIEWEARIRIDIPRFPDWTKTIKLQMLPGSFLEPLPKSLGSAQSTQVSHTGKSNSGERLDATLPGDHSAQSPGDISSPAPAGSSLNPIAHVAGSITQIASDVDGHDMKPGDLQAGDVEAGDLESMVESLMGTGPFGDGRERMIRDQSGTIYRATVSIDQVLSTNSSPGDESLVGGLTVVGRLPEANRQVQLYTRPEDNESVRGIGYGQPWSGRVMIHHWDGLYDRPVLFAV